MEETTAAGSISNPQETLEKHTERNTPRTREREIPFKELNYF